MDAQKCADVRGSAAPGLWLTSPAPGLYSASLASTTLQANGSALGLREGPLGQKFTACGLQDVGEEAGGAGFLLA